MKQNKRTAKYAEANTPKQHKKRAIACTRGEVAEDMHFVKHTLLQPWLVQCWFDENICEKRAVNIFLASGTATCLHCTVLASHTVSQNVIANR